MHFRVFSEGQGTEDIFGVAKNSNIFCGIFRGD